MKPSTVSISAILSLVVIVTTANGATKTDEVWFKGSTVDAIEKSLAMALRTPSPGMQASASQVVRDLKVLLPDQDFSLLIIPLMAIVKNEDAEAPVRMVAALALHDLKSGKGDFAIQQMARFTSNERLKHLCSWLTYERRQQKAPALRNTSYKD